MLGDDNERKKIKNFLDENFDEKKYQICRVCGMNPCKLYEKPYVCKEAGLRVVKMSNEHMQKYRIKFLPKKKNTLLEAKI